MSSEISLKENYRLFALFLILLLAAILQGLHFYFYYEQTASNAIVWSMVDWWAWFIVISVFHYFFHQFSVNTREKLYWSVFVGIILFTGVIQILLSNYINGLISTPSRQFWEDFTHLFEKRWLQNLFYAGFLWQFFNFLWPVRFKKPAWEEEVSEATPKVLKVSDGKSTYWLKPEEIRYVESARNYLFIYLKGRKILVRYSLKEFAISVSAQEFLRINRSCLVNKNYIVQIEPYSKYSKQVVLKNGKILKIGRTYLPNVEIALKN